MRAVERGNLAIVKLLAPTAEVGKVNNDGKSALMLAAEAGHAEITEVLV